MTAPYDWDTLVDSAIRQKPKEPERWRNRYRALNTMHLYFEGTFQFTAEPGEEWAGWNIYISAEDAREAAGRFDEIAKKLPGTGDTKHGETYLYLGPEKQP